MKTAKIVGIICWSLVALLLIGTLISALVGGTSLIFPSFGINTDNIKRSTTYLNQDDSYSVPIAEIENISVSWVSGNVEIVPTKEDNIYVKESSSRNLADDKKMVCAVNGSTLHIKFQENNMFFFSFGFMHKSVHIEVPQKLFDALQNLSIDTTSADTSVTGISAKTFSVSSTSGKTSISSITADNGKFNSVSGEVTLNDVTAASNISSDTTSGNFKGEKIKCAAYSGDSVSGQIYFEGETQDFDCDTTSGGIYLNSSTKVNAINCDTVSGDTTVFLPKDSEFTAELSSVSGNLQCSFPGVNSGDEIKVGSGSARYSFDSVSGGVNINSK